MSSLRSLIFIFFTSFAAAETIQTDLLIVGGTESGPNKSGVIEAQTPSGWTRVKPNDADDDGIADLDDPLPFGKLESRL